jgi:hypothetical protein
MNPVLLISLRRTVLTWLIATTLTYVGLMALSSVEFTMAFGNTWSAVVETSHMATSSAGVVIVALSALVGLAFALS